MGVADLGFRMVDASHIGGARSLAVEVDDYIRPLMSPTHPTTSSRPRCLGSGLDAAMAMAITVGIVAGVTDDSTFQRFVCL